ncbi:uncharacterized protein LOC126263467 [Schistocerca nitens]|uniref:uncharacterized protein LOC126263467 n=1 Tax=Schistocerca nitens TaxID=7011 RepID=UPI0021175AEF|nr:uncharacterized protein LOC126263467 [Schistocerca nitens]
MSSVRNGREASLAGINRSVGSARHKARRCLQTRRRQAPSSERRPARRSQQPPPLAGQPPTFQRRRLAPRAVCRLGGRFSRSLRTPPRRSLQLPDLPSTTQERTCGGILAAAAAAPAAAAPALGGVMCTRCRRARSLAADALAYRLSRSGDFPCEQQAIVGAFKSATAAAPLRHYFALTGPPARTSVTVEAAGPAASNEQTVLLRLINLRITLAALASQRAAAGAPPPPATAAPRCGDQTVPLRAPLAGGSRECFYPSNAIVSPPSPAIPRGRGDPRPPTFRRATHTFMPPVAAAD